MRSAHDVEIAVASAAALSCAFPSSRRQVQLAGRHVRPRESTRLAAVAGRPFLAFAAARSVAYGAKGGTPAAFAARASAVSKVASVPLRRWANSR